MRTPPPSTIPEVSHVADAQEFSSIMMRNNFVQHTLYEVIRQLVKEVPEDLPEMLSDQDKLKQIIINLLSNALKFTEKGEVKLSAAVEDASLKIAVSDTGVGIPADALDYIFDEFRQVDGSSTREHGGTGLGLSITKKLTHIP